MQAINSTVRQVQTVARPASGSAFLAGHVVTVTVPLLAMGDELLAIGDEWSALCVVSDESTLPSVILIGHMSLGSSLGQLHLAPDGAALLGAGDDRAGVGAAHEPFEQAFVVDLAHSEGEHHPACG